MNSHHQFLFDISGKSDVFYYTKFIILRHGNKGELSYKVIKNTR